MGNMAIFIRHPSQSSGEPLILWFVEKRRSGRGRNHLFELKYLTILSAMLSFLIFWTHLKSLGFYWIFFWIFLIPLEFFESIGNFFGFSWIQASSCKLKRVHASYWEYSFSKFSWTFLDACETFVHAMNFLLHSFTSLYCTVCLDKYW